MKQPQVSKSERTRQHIIEQSAVLFNLKGFAGTSYQDLIDATGVTKGCLYGHFASKEELAVAAFEFAAKTLMDRVGSAMAPYENAGERLRALLNFYRTYLSNPIIAGGCPLLNTAVEADDNQPALHERVVRVMNRLHKGVRNLIELGKEQGQFQPSADTHAIATFFISTVEGGILLAKAYGDEKPLQTVLDQLERWLQLELGPF
ncbi:TetR/AcrR family transcriptional regulator [Rufibacter glacialis]|uniref:TetR/AcrR family transcriptional regulator n=1 Tax=Rufibacter glacialis TaxID=1259555 RepID=A0A5M8QI77_9BACT|nr:TetR/AcrR family transcriptional regulator [Rufibacter glacialis]KAA6435817.1 TetR/AcrR family transcriptional regulator [Rufibacter glacialis]GGK66839.1 TetR family transcriptional regulator [Rufibacter glacialis]